MPLDKNQTDTRLIFEHDIAGCGCKFETRIGMLKDFPEKVVCPGCPAQENENRVRVLKEFGHTAAKLLELKVSLDRDFNFKLINSII